MMCLLAFVSNTITCIIFSWQLLMRTTTTAPQLYRIMLKHCSLGQPLQEDG